MPKMKDPLAAKAIALLLTSQHSINYKQHCEHYYTSATKMA